MICWKQCIQRWNRFSSTIGILKCSCNRYIKRWREEKSNIFSKSWDNFNQIKLQHMKRDVYHYQGTLRRLSVLQRPLKLHRLQRQEAEITNWWLLATCVQHEIDHLNGIIDYLSKLKRDMVIKNLKNKRNK